MQAAGLKKGFEALKVQNYFLAREIFLKQVRKHPAAAWYGLSVITGRADNPFYRIDSSYAYIQRADVAYGGTPVKERKAILAFGVDAAAITAQREHVFAAAWDLARSANTITEYDRFIAHYGQSPQAADAVLVRDYLAFQEAREANTAAAYQAFLDRHPDAREAYEARNRLQEATFRESVPDGTIEQYERFIAEHGDSPYVRNAQDALYKLSAPHRSPEELIAFIHRYPHDPHVPEAWRSIYEQRTRDLSTSSITRFIRDYPDYPFINELAEDYNTASLVLRAFRHEGKWGYIDEKGVERIKAVYEFAEPFHGGQAQVGMDGHAGTINKMGRVVVPLECDDVLDPSDGISTVERGDKAGAVDRTGNVVVPLMYQEVGEFSGGLAYAKKDGRYGFVDLAGNEVIPARFDAANTFRNGVAVVGEQGRFGVIDARGNVVVPFDYDWVEGFTAPVSRVRKDGRMGVISPFGDVLLPVEHEHVGIFNEGFAMVMDKGRCGYVTMEGTWAVPQQYDLPPGLPLTWGDVHNGVARVMVGGKMALIDMKGERVLPPQYLDIGIMECGAVPVKKKAKWGYASRAYTTVAEARYDGAWEMHECYARVKVNDLFGLIDSTGKEVIAPTYLGLDDVHAGLLVARDKSGTGVLEVNGKVRVPLLYDAVERVDEEVAKVTRGERFGYVRLADGQFIWKEEGFDAE